MCETSKLFLASKVADLRLSLDFSLSNIDGARSNNEHEVGKTSHLIYWDQAQCSPSPCVRAVEQLDVWEAEQLAVEPAVLFCFSVLVYLLTDPLADHRFLATRTFLAVQPAVL